MLQEKFVRFQLDLFKPFISTCSLETARSGQDKLGQLLTSVYKKDVTFKEYKTAQYTAEMITPKDPVSDGVILYLHGGGYTCGDIKYAKGFGTTLAAKCGIRVFCPAYRLAPENVFPAAVEDALAAYRQLITLGFSPAKIVLCGESAGGGLIFSLCLKLKSLGYTMPAGIIAISPWTDLTLSGKSFETNKDIDPSMTYERLKYYADCYVHGDNKGIENLQADKKLKSDPLVSPLFGDLANFPKTLMFVGSDEIMLDDTRIMSEALKKAGNDCKTVIKKGMWHGYVLYCLKENEDDFDLISKFLKDTIPDQKKLRWMKLDNAAKIYPAIKRKQWINFFRLSATLNEEIDLEIMQSALDVTVRRFPSIAVRLRIGLFWYYLEEIPKSPKILDEKPYPLARAPLDDIKKCAFRTIVYNNRVAVEFFHAITDGNGGLVFLKTLVAEYLTQKHSIEIPCTNGVLDRLEIPNKLEIEDSFMRYGGKVNASRNERNAYHISGTPEKDSFCTNTTFILNQNGILNKAKEKNVSVTALLSALLMESVLLLQEEKVKNPMKRRDVRILIPVDLRRIFDSITLRNFVLYIITGVDAKLGDYSVDELCRIIHNQMNLELTKKEMTKRIAVNVNTEKNPVLKVVPLFLKNIVMRTVFNIVGERKSCFSLSNLGEVKIPDEMKKYISRMDFVLGVQSRAPYNVGVLSLGGTMYINFIRNIKEPLLEQKFYEQMRLLGIEVMVDSNNRDE